jgi:Xaa-Pro aminopeptidase
LLNPEDRLNAFRGELTRRSLDGFVVPLTDEHMSEYVGDYARRLAWLTAFEGSSGTAVVLSTAAAIFVDGRYTLQVREQVDERYWSYQSVPDVSVAEWLMEHAFAGARIGYDPWVHTKGWVAATRSALEERGAKLVAVDSNPVDAIWSDRPRPSEEKMAAHSQDVAGQSADAKRRTLTDWLAANDADAVILSALDSVAWMFNVRGRDVAHTPVVLAYALVHIDGSADFFVAPEKVTAVVREYFGATVRLRPRETITSYLRTLANKTVAVDPERAVVAIFEALAAAGAKVLEVRDPVVLLKATKNATEIAGHKAAQVRDGAALSRFLYWFSMEAPKGVLTEMSAAARLQECREATGRLRDLSFATIAGFGPNSAIVHYGVTARTNRAIVLGSLFLVDSGGQYLDGTTDVTRTVAVGIPTHEMRDRFTRVLKGHIALARAVFPVGTRGGQLDMLARSSLWDVGLDYAHGTGHGVGSYLCVHEGPQRIIHPQAPVGGGEEPLRPGMILSNEPGYYKSGEFGIRIENLMLVVRRAMPGAEREMLGFETLTFAPIDRSLIDVSLLCADEREWVDAYHAAVARVVGPQLEGAEQAWLLQVTRPLESSGHQRESGAGPACP